MRKHLKLRNRQKLKVIKVLRVVMNRLMAHQESHRQMDKAADNHLQAVSHQWAIKVAVKVAALIHRATITAVLTRAN